MLARFAADPSFAKNKTNYRYFNEDESNFRSCYQRDRDRNLHCSAFRRLKHKTQVFVEHEGDYFRTRLTHTLEVAQVARTCLLYTSPSPRDATLSRMPSSA